MKQLIGDYQRFFTDLVYRLKQADITLTGLPITHLLYRTRTLSEYEKLRDQLKPFCKEFVETMFNGRAVSILVLEKPLKLAEGYSVSMIELPAPRAVHMYPSGLESIGVFVGKKLPVFKKKYQKVLTGIKEHGKYCQPAFITFENEKTVKFYDYTLYEIVLKQGWKYEYPLAPDSLANKIAKEFNKRQFEKLTKKES